MKHLIKLLILIMALIAGCTGVKKSITDRELIQELNKIDVETQKVEQGVLIHLPVIMLFDLDSDKLKNDSLNKIAQIAGVLNRPEVAQREIIVSGHADAMGDEAHNLDLSRRRAKSVTDEFVFNGVHKSRIESHGYGESRPIAPNTHPDGSDNPEGRAKNRRVEVIIKSLEKS